MENESNVSSVKNEVKQVKTVKINPTGHFKGQTMNIFKVIISILIGVALIRVLGGSQPLSVQSLLEYMGNAPVIQMPFKFFRDFSIVADWGLFNFLRDFFNVLAGVTSIIVFLATGIVNAIMYLAYFIRYIFV